MQEKGLEPSLLIQKADFESAASADSAIPAYGLWCGTSTCSRIFVILSDLPKNNNLGFLCQISANSRNRVRTKAMAETYLGASVPFQIFPDLPAQHHLFLHDGKEFLRGLSPATPDPGCSMEIANVKCLAGVLLLPHAGCYERDDSVVALVAPAGESPVPGLISKDALLHPVQEIRCQAFPSGYTAVLSRQCPVPDEKTIGSTVPWSASSPL